MALQTQTVPISFGQGVDTKTDSKQVSGGKTLRLQDAVFTQAKQIDKRNGYQPISNAKLDGGALVLPQLLKTLNQDLFCEDQNHIYSYSPTSSSWVDNGPYIPMEATKSTIAAPSLASSSHVFQTQAISGEYALFAWVSDVLGGGIGPGRDVLNTYWDFRDMSEVPGGKSLATGVEGDASFYSDVDYPSPKCFTMNPPLAGTTGLCMLSVDGGSGSGPTAALGVYLYQFSIAVGTGVTRTETLIGTDFAANNHWAGLPTPPSPIILSYDVAPTATGFVVVYSRSAGAMFGDAIDTLAVKTFSNTGTLLNSITLPTSILSPVAQSYPISIKVASNGNIWVFWSNIDESTNNPDMFYAVLTPTLGVILAATSIGLVDPFLGNTGSETSYLENIAIIEESPTEMQALYCGHGLFDPSGRAVPLDATRSVAVSITGTQATRPFSLTYYDLASKPFVQNGLNYVACLFKSQANFGAEANVVIEYVPVPATYSFSPTQVLTAQSISGAGMLYDFPQGFMPNPIALSATEFSIISAVSISNNVQGGVKEQILSTGLLTYDFASPNMLQSVVANNTAVLTGGVTQLYDGETIAELGFTDYPIIQSLVNSPGVLPVGSWVYYAVYEWTDAQGNFYQSAPSPGFTFTNDGGSGDLSPILIISTPLATNKRTNISVALYRTTNGTNAAFLTASGPYADGYVQLQDSTTDARLLGSSALYTNGGILENIGPPPVRSMTVFRNRLWLIDSENPNTLWYSKTIEPGVGISMTDLLTEQVDSVAGEVIALAAMDDKLVVLAQNAPLLIGGDGANDAGQGSTLSPAQIVPSDVGCSQSKGVKTFPMGVLFKSPKGIYLLDRSTQVKYWGAEVEQYNAQDVVSTTLNETKSQIRFLTDAGLTLVYDYVFNQWSTFTNHMGYSADIWMGNYVYARTDGPIYKETPGYYLDDSDPISVLIQTEWLDMGSVQGFQRVKMFDMLGNYTGADGHGVTVTASYNFAIDASTDPVTYLFTGLKPTYQYRQFLSRQKCDSVSFLIQEITTGSSAEYVTFTDMSFEAGVKKGLNKKTAADSVG